LIVKSADAAQEIVRPTEQRDPTYLVFWPLEKNLASSVANAHRVCGAEAKFAPVQPADTACLPDDTRRLHAQSQRIGATDWPSPNQDRMPAGCAADSARQCSKMAYEPPIDQAKPHQMKIPVAIAIMTRTANVRPFLKTAGTTGSPAKTRVFIASPHPNHAAQI
jgi:hypothetical protein